MPLIFIPTSPAEVDFLREYDDMVKEFRNEFKDISGDDNLGGEIPQAS